MTIRLYPWILTPVLAALLSFPAMAQTPPVTNTNGDTSSGSLGAALSSANADTANSDTITFSTLFDSPQTINLVGPYATISKSAGESLNLTAPDQLTIDTGSYAGLAFTGGGDFYLGDVTLEGGSPADPILSVSGNSTAVLSQVDLAGDVALNDGTLEAVTSVGGPIGVALTGLDTIAVAAGQSSNFSGAISGTGTLITSGSGTLVLSAVMNTYSGGTQINQGTLEVSQQYANATPLGTGPIAINGAGTLALTGLDYSFVQNEALMAGGGTFSLGTAPTVELTSLSRTAGGGLVIVPTGSTTLGATQRIVFSTTPTVTNGIVDASIVAASSSSDTSADFLTYDSTVIGSDFGLARATYSTATSITNGGANGTTSTSVFQAAMNTNNNITSPTTLYALKVDSGVTVGGAPLTLGDGTHTAGLIINGNASSTPTTIDSEIIFATGSEGAVYVGGNGTSVYAKIADPVTGANGLTKNGNGSLEIAYPMYSGTTTVNGGTLQFDTDNSASPGVAPDSVINLASTLLYTGLNSGGNMNGTINLTADGTLASGGNNVLNLDGTINGNGHMLSFGNPTATSLIEVGGTQNNVSGFNIAAGTVEISGTLDNAGVPITLGAENAVMLVEANTVIANPLNFNGGTVETSGTVTFSGSYAITNGSSQFTALAGSSVTLNGQFTSGTTGLSLNGGGTFSITGSSPHYGGAIVNSAGSLDITGSLPQAEIISVNLSGTGTIGLLYAGAGARIHPGESGAIGTLAASSLQWYSDSSPQLQFQLSNTSNASSLLTLGTGSFTSVAGSSSTFAFDFLDSGEAGQDYDLINFGAGNTNFQPSDFSATDLPAGLSANFNFVTNGNTESLMADVVPEPGTDATLALGLIVLAAVTRARLARQTSHGHPVAHPLDRETQPARSRLRTSRENHR